MKLLVTGGAGFIGSAVIRHIVRDTDWQVANVDKLTYAGNLESLAEAGASNRHPLLPGRHLATATRSMQIFHQVQPDAIMHLAAESHVDRSIDGAARLHRDQCRGHLSLCSRPRSPTGARSTPSAQGALPLPSRLDRRGVRLAGRRQALFTEATPYAPNSPYSATKAASDHLVRAWHHTYGLPTLITNCSNNYGPYHFPEKLIPLMIIRALRGEPLPVYGDGRECARLAACRGPCRARYAVLQKGRPGETYNVGGDSERSNIDVVRAICRLLDELLPDAPSAARAS